MKKYGIRDVQIHLTTLLEELPFAITRYGKVIAKVNAPNTNDVTVRPPETKINLCPHNSPFGLCKLGCK